MKTYDYILRLAISLRTPYTHPPTKSLIRSEGFFDLKVKCVFERKV